MTFGALVRQNEGLLSQKDVCRKLDINEQLLRYWQQRGSIPFPTATQKMGTRKYYTPNELKVIRKFFAKRDDALHDQGYNQSSPNQS
jgi:DNA-binding transcriptional MerR regulator